MGIGTLTARLVVVAVVWIAVALVAGGFLLAALFESHVNRSFDRRLETLLEALVAVTDADTGAKDVIRVLGPQGDPRFDQPYSGLYWQINDGGTMRLASRSLWDQTLALRTVAPAQNPDGIPLRRYETAGPRGQRLRVIERDITLEENGPTLRYAVAGDLAQVEEEFRPFVVTLIWSLTVLGLGLVVAVLIQVYVGLRPLDRLREALGRVRAGRAERLEGDFPSEVRPLVDEANQLIAHIGDVVERARTHVGNLAHALKTPLSVLANEADRADGPLADAVARETAAMQERIDHHLARARTAATAGVLGQRAEVRAALDGLGRALKRMYAEKALDLDIACDDDASDGPLSFRGDAHDLEEMLGNLMENACKWANTRVTVEAKAAEGGRMRVTVEDDGPGLGPEDREAALTRGRRLDETVPGSGLGLAIVSEIAGLYDGALTLDDAALGGLSATLDLPRAIG
ncbi:MAG: sensor histidine kinase [Alphaproteobacteria bacterium]|nr:sensor histidine kinase [Alphaproteobacteria bacterium]